MPEHYRGAKISKVKSEPGIYAWYYKPFSKDWNLISKHLNKIFSNQAQLETKVSLRYGLSLISKSEATLAFSSDHSELHSLLETFDVSTIEAFSFFLKSEYLNFFTKPLYIGIAKNLNDRVFKGHYTLLTQYSEPSSSVSKYLSSNPDSTVNTVMKDLNLRQSFALEARVRNISPNDLVVYTFPTNDIPIEDDDKDGNEPSMRRNIERVLQLLTDPVCGRR